MRFRPIFCPRWEYRPDSNLPAGRQIRITMQVIKKIRAEVLPDDDSKMESEIKTSRLMIELYCRYHHGSKDILCNDCSELFDYVKKRLEKCPLKDNKPKCSQCTVHCYNADMRGKIKAVMRYSGPRMLYRHPILTAKHYLSKK